MIKLLIFLAITASLNAQHLPARNAENTSRFISKMQNFALAQDKQLHMGACYAISSFTSALVYRETKDKTKATVYGFGVAMLAGVIKEVYDINNGHSDINDILANTIGSSLGVVTIRITL